jgi:hypothetical protein
MGWPNNAAESLNEIFSGYNGQLFLLSVISLSRLYLVSFIGVHRNYVIVRLFGLSGS